MKWDTPDALAAYLEDNPTSDAMQAAAATIRAQAKKITDLESAIKRQANAAISGMDAAKASATHDLQAAQRLRAESSPEALASERAANAVLTEEISRLRIQIMSASEGAQEAARAERVYRQAEALLTADERALTDAATEARAERDAAREDRDRLRAALEIARDFVAEALAQERDAYRGYESVSDIAAIERYLGQIDAALTQEERHETV